MSHPRSSSPARLALACCCAAACLALASAGTGQQPPVETPKAEQKPAEPCVIKAAALYKVALYAKWPEAALGGKEDPLRVAVYGAADPFGSALEHALKGKKQGNHPFRALHFATLEELGECQILFVPESEEAQLPKILEKYKGRPVLIVGESATAAESGAGVALYFEKSKLQVAVNLQAVRASGIELSSELLKLARVIGSKPEGQGK